MNVSFRWSSYKSSGNQHISESLQLTLNQSNWSAFKHLISHNNHLKTVKNISLSQLRNLIVFDYLSFVWLNVFFHFFWEYQMVWLILLRLSVLLWMLSRQKLCKWNQKYIVWNVWLSSIMDINFMLNNKLIQCRGQTMFNICYLYK